MDSPIPTALVIGLGQTGEAIVNEFGRALPPNLQDLPSITALPASIRDGQFYLGEASARRTDPRSLRRIVKEVLDGQFDSQSQTLARRAGIRVDYSRLYTYVVAGPELGAAAEVELVCQLLAQVADAVGVHQLHTSIVLVVPDVLEMSEEEESELPKLLEALNRLSGESPSLASGSDGQRVTALVPYFDCAWIIQDRNLADMVTREKPELLRLVGQSLTLMVCTDLGPTIHKWHGACRDGSEDSVALGSFGIAVVRYPYDHTFDHLFGEVMVTFHRAFEEAQEPPSSHFDGLSAKLLDAEGATLETLGYELGQLSNREKLVQEAGGSGKQGAAARALEEAELRSRTIVFDSDAAVEVLARVERRTVDSVRNEMTASMVRPSGLLQAAALAESAVGLAQTRAPSGEGRQRYHQRLDDRQRELEVEFGSRNSSLNERELDLAVAHEHYLLGHALAHVFTLAAALLAYVVVPLAILRIVRSLPVGDTVSTGYWLFLIGVLMTGLVLAPLLNVYLRSYAELRLRIPLVRQLNLAMLIFAVPGVLALVYFLKVSQDFGPGDIRLVLASVAFGGFLALWLVPDILKALWERAVSAARWVVDHVLLPIGRAIQALIAFIVSTVVIIIVGLVNAVRKGFRMPPISVGEPAGEPASDREPGRPSGQSSKPEPQGLRSDTAAERVERINRVLARVHPVQYVGHLFVLSFAVIFFAGLLFAGVIESLDRLPETAASSAALERAEDAALAAPELSAAAIILMVAAAVLVLDYVGAQLGLSEYRRQVQLDRGEAQRTLVGLIDTRVENQAAKWTAEIFESVADQLAESANGARQVHIAFASELGKAMEVAEAKIESSLSLIIDDSGHRPTFSIFKDRDSIVSWYSARLGGPYPESRDVRARELAADASELVFKSWQTEGAGEAAAREAVAFVRSDLRGLLAPDLGRDFFRENEVLLRHMLNDYRSPRWKYTVTSLSDSDPRTADFAIASYAEDLVRGWLPEAHSVIEYYTSAQVALVSAVYGLPTYSIPEWSYLQGRRAATSPACESRDTRGGQEASSHALARKPRGDTRTD